MQGDFGVGGGETGPLSAVSTLVQSGAGGTSYYRGSGRAAARAQAQLQQLLTLRGMQQQAVFHAFDVAQSAAAQQQASTGIPTSVVDVTTPSKTVKALLDVAKSVQTQLFAARGARQQRRAAREAAKVQRDILHATANVIPTYVPIAQYGIVNGGPLVGSRDDPSGTLDVRSYALSRYGRL